VFAYAGNNPGSLVARARNTVDSEDIRALVGALRNS
jgi:hypothetical protein